MRVKDVIKLGNICQLDYVGEAYNLVLKNLYILMKEGKFSTLEVTNKCNELEKELNKVDDWEHVPLTEASRLWK